MLDLLHIFPEPISIISQFGFPTSGVRSSFIKEILRRVFKGRIGFLSGGGSYVEAALPQH